MIKSFKIIPAIDILNSQCVRLIKGDYSKSTVYDYNPSDLSNLFLDAGLDLVHVVDLDGARDGKPCNLSVVERISSTGIKIELGGGLRTLKNIEEAINSGVSNVVVGTSAINDVSFLQNACNKFSNQISVSIDSKNGLIATQGWKKITQKNVLKLAA